MQRLTQTTPSRSLWGVRTPRHEENDQRKMRRAFRLAQRVRDVVRAFYETFDGQNREYFYVDPSEVWDEFLVAFEINAERFFRVPYEYNPDERSTSFADRGAFQEVEQIWQDRTLDPIAWATSVLDRVALVRERIEDPSELKLDGLAARLFEHLPEDAVERRAPVLDEPHGPLFDISTLVGDRETIVRDVATTYREASDGETSTFAINTSGVDRYGTIIEGRGIDTTAYMRNPVVLWQHGRDAQRGFNPIARTTSLVWNEKREAWIATIVWADDDFARDIRAKVRDGFLSAASVSIRPTSRPSTREIEGQHVTQFGESELLEWSIVAVPGNAETLATDRDDDRLSRLEGLVERLASSLDQAQIQPPQEGVAPETESAIEEAPEERSAPDVPTEDEPESRVATASASGTEGATAPDDASRGSHPTLRLSPQERDALVLAVRSEIAKSVQTHVKRALGRA